MLKSVDDRVYWRGKPLPETLPPPNGDWWFAIIIATLIGIMLAAAGSA